MTTRLLFGQLVAAVALVAVTGVLAWATIRLAQEGKKQGEAFRALADKLDLMVAVTGEAVDWAKAVQNLERDSLRRQLAEELEHNFKVTKRLLGDDSPMKFETSVWNAIRTKPILDAEGMADLAVLYERIIPIAQGYVSGLEKMREIPGGSKWGNYADTAVNNACVQLLTQLREPSTGGVGSTQ